MLNIFIYIFLYVGGMLRVLGPSFPVVMLTIMIMMLTTMMTMTMMMSMTMAMTPNMPSCQPPGGQQQQQQQQQPQQQQPPGGGGEKWGGRMSLCEDGPAGTFVFALLSIVIFLQIQKIKRDGTSPLRSVVAGSGGRQSAGCLTLNVDTVLLLLIYISMMIIVLISTYIYVDDVLRTFRLG